MRPYYDTPNRKLLSWIFQLNNVDEYTRVLMAAVDDVAISASMHLM